MNESVSRAECKRMRPWMMQADASTQKQKNMEVCSRLSSSPQTWERAERCDPLNRCLMLIEAPVSAYACQVSLTLLFEL
jgi:hypothetical protein